MHTCAMFAQNIPCGSRVMGILLTVSVRTDWRSNYNAHLRAVQSLICPQRRYEDTFHLPVVLERVQHGNIRMDGRTDGLALFIYLLSLRECSMVTYGWTDEQMDSRSIYCAHLRVVQLLICHQRRYEDIFHLPVVFERKQDSFKIKLLI